MSMCEAIWVKWPAEGYRVLKAFAAGIAAMGSSESSMRWQYRWRTPGCSIPSGASMACMQGQQEKAMRTYTVAPCYGWMGATLMRVERSSTGQYPHEQFGAPLHKSPGPHPPPPHNVGIENPHCGNIERCSTPLGVSNREAVDPLWGFLRYSEVSTG